MPLTALYTPPFFGTVILRMKPLFFPFSLLVFLTCMGLPVSFADTPQKGATLLEQVKQRIRNLTTPELQAMLESNPQLVMVDVRTSSEILLLGGSIDGQRSYNIPAGWLELRIEDRVADKNTPIVVYCGVNERSPLTADRLTQLGYREVYNYSDGFFAWRDAGLPVKSPDQALASQLYRLPEKVSSNVWSAIGATAPGTYANGGHNNNLSFVVTGGGVLVFNAGDNYLLARALHSEIKKITEQPVRYLVWENGQGHAVGGSAYWKEQGAHIIAHEDAAEKVRLYGEQIFERIVRRQRDKGMGTRMVMPDETFKDSKIIELGGEQIELLHLGPAHSPGDISAWLPRQKLVIAGDIAFNQRLLPVFEETDTGAWVETWDAFAALGAETVIPGHGDPTDMPTVTAHTRDYLVDMRRQIGDLIENGGTLDEVSQVDQSRYKHLDTFEQLSALNASTIFRQMEFE